MCRTIKILILNWPRTRKFSLAVALDFAHSGHSLVTLYAQFLSSDWSKFDGWVHDENLCSILNLVYFTEFCVNLWCFKLSFSTGCTKWNSADIRRLLLFMASLFTGFFVEKYVTCQSRKSDFGWHRFRFWPCLMRKRVEKSEAMLALLDTFRELHLQW